LQAQSVEAGAAPRKLDTLSVGTREQLATLLRLAIAGHLHTAVVLDDQLGHSDSERLEWFRERLCASAREHEHQVIVLTCRPGDYVRSAANDGVTLIDLVPLMSR
jgi:uncharacterized protein YhaN